MKKFFLLLIPLVVLLLFGAGNTLALTVGFDPLNKKASTGSTFDINITANVTASEALVGWGFGLLYSPAQLKLNTVSTSSYWDLISDPSSSSLSALLLPGPTSPDPGLSGSNLLLATLNFTCLGPGVSSLDISVDPSDDTQGFMTFDGKYAKWESMAGTVEQVVPEPGTFLLLGFGLAGVCLLKKRFRRPIDSD